MSFKDNTYLERQISEELDRASGLRKQINREYRSLVQLLQDFKDYQSIENNEMTFDQYQELIRANQVDEESSKSSAKSSSIASKKPIGTQKKISYFSGRKLASSSEVQVQVGDLLYPSNVEIFDAMLKKDKAASHANL